MPEIKAVVFDLDDTLLHDDLSVSVYTAGILRRLHRRGFSIIAASGRARFSMLPYVDQIGCVDAYISCNGAEIWDGPSHRLIRQELFSEETALDIVRFGEDRDCYIQVYEGKCFYFNRECIHERRYAYSSKLTGIYAGKLSDYIHEPRNKVLMIDDEQRIASLYKEACVLFSETASVTCSKPIYLEFNPLNATKGIALQTVAEFLGLRTENMIVFGDSLNDLPMLKAAGVAVAVANGRPEIRAMAHFVCGSNNFDGPAHFLNDHYLSKEVMR